MESFLYLLKQYHYDLPKDLIAVKPASERDQSRLLVLDRAEKKTSHHKMSDIPDFLSAKDALVINNTEVIPGRLAGKKETGGKVEALIVDYPTAVREKSNNGSITFKCMVKASKKLAQGSAVFFQSGLTATVKDYDDGIYSLVFSGVDDVEKTIEQTGQIPLPPYIVKGKDPSDDFDDKAAYQTIYASKKGAIAAPTAGLHFSKAIFDRLESRGVEVVPITLHVGHGTFLPVRVDDIRDHKMHSEVYDISESAARSINRVKENGGRVVAVGTTCARTLENSSDEHGKIVPGSGNCDLFIYPGYKFKAVDALITNFHLPESTLLMLVSAFADREMIFSAYQTAMDAKYRFYSYGDAMYIK